MKPSCDIERAEHFAFLRPARAAATQRIKCDLDFRRPLVPRFVWRKTLNMQGKAAALMNHSVSSGEQTCGSTAEKLITNLFIAAFKPDVFGKFNMILRY